MGRHPLASVALVLIGTFVALPRWSAAHAAAPIAEEQRGGADVDRASPELSGVAMSALRFSSTEGSPEDVSKLDSPSSDRLLIDKIGSSPKTKACCGFPLSQREGFRLTFYWLAYEQEYASAAYDTPVYTRDGFLIGRYPSAFVYEMILEGTGVLLDGRVLNYAGRCEYGVGTCFRTLDPAEHPLGHGVQGRPLVPFRSVAVDPKRIPIGAPVWVPELVGLELPDGSRHDGCVRADDMGGAIKAGKMDFFVESMANFKFLAEGLWWRLKATPHLEEPRCEYLRTGLATRLRERTNEKVDWVALHSTRGRPSDRAALARISHVRAVAKAWVKRHTEQARALAAATSSGARVAAGSTTRARRTREAKR